MSCERPLLAVDLGLKDNGKRAIKFLPQRVDFDYSYYKERYGDSLLMLPCGKCSGCVLARRKMWSLRCYAESLYHEKNCFVTLTYDDLHRPVKANKTDFQLFIKQLRNHGITCRYFGCGEYGGKTGKFHMHIVLFGFFPDDVKYFSKTKSGFPQFTSNFLTDIWQKGFVTVSEFTPETAAYTAGYVDKKYKVDDSFILMSKRPGIGQQYFMDHYKEIYETDSMIVNNGSHVSKIPRYFDKLAENIGLDLSELKDFRLQQMNYQTYKDMRDLGAVHLEELLNVRAQEFRDRLERKKRGL